MRRLAPLLAALVAGCGGDTPQERTRAEWQEEVSAVCERNAADGREIAQEIQREDPNLSEREYAARVLERSVEATREQLAEMRAIRPPANLQAGYDRFLDRIGEAADLFPDLAAEVRAGRDGADITRRLRQIALPTRNFALDNGLDACVPDA